MTTIATTPTTATPQMRRPATATVAAGMLLAFGTLTACGGMFFSAAEGGLWLAATPCFAVALVGWWLAGLGVLRGTARGRRLGLVMTAALFAFSVYKIVVVHEQTAWLFQAVCVVMATLLSSSTVRSWVIRR